MLLQKKEFDRADITILPEEKQTEIIEIKNNIKFDHESISTYSQGVSKKLTDFSTQILDSVKIKDSPEVETMLIQLMTELDTLDTETLIERKPSLFRKLFKTNSWSGRINRERS